MSDTTSTTQVAEWVPPAPARTPATTGQVLIAVQTRDAPVERLIQRANRAASRLVPQARYQLSRLGPAGVLGAGAATVAAVIAAFALLSLGPANEDLGLRILRAQHRHEAPLTPEQGLTRVIDQLPTRAQMPAVLGQVLQQAQAAGLELTKGQYSYRAASKSELGSYELDFPVMGQYSAIRDFIDHTLTNIPAAGVHKLTLQRKVIGDSQVIADVRLVVFVRDR